MMIAAVATASQTILLSALSELGDKTFFLTAIFAVWCPFGGIRSGRNSTVQQCLVAGGCTTALAARVVLATLGINIDGTDSWLGLASIVLLGLMAAKAVAELRRADLQKKAEFFCQKPPVDPRHFGRGNSFSDRRGMGGFLGDFTAYNPDNYQTDVQGASSSYSWLPAVGIGGANHLESADPRVPPNYGTTDGLASLADPALAGGSELPFEWACAFAFIVPLVAVFVAEAGDKSQAALQSVSGAGAVGVLVGYGASTLFAVFLGFLLERTVSERRVLFAVGLGLTCLCMVLISQGFLASSQGLVLSLRARGAAVAASKAVAKVVPSPAASLVAMTTPAASSSSPLLPTAQAIAPLAAAAMSAVPAATTSSNMLLVPEASAAMSAVQAATTSSNMLLVPEVSATMPSLPQGRANDQQLPAFVQVPRRRLSKQNAIHGKKETKTPAAHGQAERASKAEQPPTRASAPELKQHAIHGKKETKTPAAHGQAERASKAEQPPTQAK